MGQHKTNPVAIAAKEGKLPPKPKKPSKREQEAALNAALDKAIRKVVGLTPADFMAASRINEYYK